MATEKRFGFVTICGLPNAGKSTLLNALVGKKVAAVSYKPQTTRFNILSVFELDATQVALVDTPGLFRPQHPVDKFLRKSSYHAIKQAQLIMVVVDISLKNQKPAHELLTSLLQQYAEFCPFFIVFNKIDQIASSALVEQSFEFQNYSTIRDFFMISAEKKTGLDVLKAQIVQQMPEQDWMYPQHSILHNDIHRWAAELTMEQIFKNLDSEIPYQTYIEPLHMEEAEDGIHFYQNIIISKSSHKPIVLGRKGQVLKTIGSAARLNIAHEMKRRVHLHLFVKVIPNWMQLQGSLRDSGLLGE